MKKTRAEIDEIESKNTLDSINKAKSWSFKWYHKKSKPLVRLIKKKKCN